MLHLTINGEAATLAEPADRRLSCCSELGYDRRRVAVEVNGEVVPRRRHAEQPLADGDRIEIVTLVGGGAADEAAGRQTAGRRQVHLPQPAHHRHRQIRQLRPDARLPGRQRLRSDHRGRAPRTAGRQGGPQHPRLSRPEALHDPAEHGRLLQRRGRHPPRPPGPRAAEQPRQSRAPTGSSWSAWAIRRRCCPTRSPRCRRPSSW